MKKVAYVTGAGAGIGQAIALQLAQDGYDLAVNDLREELLTETIKKVKKLGVDVIPLAGDVSDEAAVTQNFKKLKEHYGRLDLLVNNAGICPIRKVDGVTQEMMERSFNINVVSMFLNAKAAFAIMKGQKEGGVILNAASQSAFRETPVTYEYTTTKWSIRGMTKAMAQAMKPYGIRVNAYCPGTVLTPMQDKIAKQTAKEMHVPAFVVRKFQLHSQELGRFQPMEEIAQLVSFLASDKAKYITGQNVLCNGGQVMN